MQWYFEQNLTNFPSMVSVVLYSEYEKQRNRSMVCALMTYIGVVSIYAYDNKSMVCVIMVCIHAQYDSNVLAFDCCR